MKLQDIITSIQDYHPTADFEVIRKAYGFVRNCHKGQTRASGEPFITHVTEVAYLASKLKLDTNSIAAALLHDSVEDTAATLDQVSEEFGKEIAELVDGVTKLSQVKFSSRAEAQAENFRKMLLAMAKDIRVLLLKLCDRVHNMRTLEFLPEHRRIRIAEETLDIYAPLAHRLGMYWMKSELEDLSFKYLNPEVYENIRNYIDKTEKDQSRYIEEVVQLISREMEQNKVQGVVTGRPKHLYSIYQKMEQRELHFNEIYDIIAFRIVVDTLMHCYGALGVVHAAWKPIPGRFKDYIAMPKPNNYQSLHTTVIGPKGHRIEIQIRTEEMHSVAEQGIAAHWVYKESSSSKKTSHDAALQFHWLKELIESEKLHRDPMEFLSVIKDDLFPQEVFVFSPKGDLFAFPTDATPIDFAYHIHSEVGHRCTGARVNGQQVSLSHKLNNGDTVEIITSENQVPGKDWINNVVTAKAKQRIRSWLKAQERDRSIIVGKELLSKDLRKVKLNLNKLIKNGELEKIATDIGLKELDLLFAEIGYGKLPSVNIVKKLLPDEKNVDEKLARDDSAIQKIFQRAARRFRDSTGIKVSGMDDVVCRFSKCCEPLPGDELVGYVTRGRGIAVHKRNCAQTLSYDPRRLIPVTWDDTVKTLRRVKLKIVALDKVGVLAGITQSISNNGANIVNASVAANSDGKALATFELNVENSSQLSSITRALQRIDGVLRVERTFDEKSV